MSVRNLDEFIQEEKPTLEYEIKGKKIIGDISTLNILKASSLYSRKEMIENQDKMTVELFNIIFGKENSTYLINALSPKGFVTVAEEVTKAIMGETGTDNKSPSAGKE